MSPTAEPPADNVPGVPSPPPFTLIACAGCAPSAAPGVLERLRQVVRDCPRGLLVSTGCLGAGGLWCRPKHGLYAVVQPCTVERAPCAPAIHLGPLTTAADADAVGEWLLAGLPEHGGLPSRLRASPPAERVAKLN
jgi:hypothetical protein